MRYIALYNQSGFLPETDPEVFDSFEEAQRHLAGICERFSDDEYDYAQDMNEENCFEEADEAEDMGAAFAEAAETVRSWTDPPQGSRSVHVRGGFAFEIVAKDGL